MTTPVPNPAKWDDLKVFVEYGMLTEDKFYEKAEKFALLKNTKGEALTIADYIEKIKPIQTDKNEKPQPFCWIKICRKLADGKFINLKETQFSGLYGVS